MADEPGGMGGEDLRARRRAAKHTQTYSLFLKDLCALSGLPRERAEKALVSVLCALEQRLVQGEAEDLRAQLPQKLQEALRSCAPRHEQAPGKVRLEGFLQRVAEDIGGDPPLAESVIRAVFATVRAHITEGEAEQVGNELPADLRALWARPI